MMHYYKIYHLSVVFVDSYSVRNFADNNIFYRMENEIRRISSERGEKDLM